MNELPTFPPLCKVDPTLEDDPVALRLADLAGLLSPHARVLITTSDKVMVLPEDVLFSAQSKLSRLGVNSPTAFQWVARNEQTVDWNRIKTEEDLRRAASTRFAERSKTERYLLNIDAGSGTAQSEVDALRKMAAGDPQAANVLRAYEANPTQRWGELMEYVNRQRAENVTEWRTYLTGGNEEYAKDPFWQDCAWDIVDGALTNDRNRGLGTTVHLNQGVLADLRQSINGKMHAIALAANYAKLQADMARASAADSVTTGSAREWVYIPSKAEDEVNFQANVQKLKDLSCASWCTKTYNAEPYLSAGGAWLLTEGNRTIAQIRLKGDRVAEIQGVKNDSVIPPEAGPDIEDLLAARPELKGVNLWRAKNPGAPAELLTNLAETKDKEVLCAVARNGNTPPTVLNRLAELANPTDVRQAVASNEKAPAELLLRIATEDKDGEVLCAVARNGNTPPTVLNRLAELTPSELLVRIATKDGDDKELVELIAEIVADDKHGEVLDAVAQNPNTPSQALERLVDSHHSVVLLAVAQNANTPPAALCRLAESKAAVQRYDEFNQPEEIVTVKQAVADNPNTPAEALDKLSENPLRQESLEREDYSLALAVARHKNASPAALCRLVDLIGFYAEPTVASNPNTPAELLVKFSGDQHFKVREGVASNESTPSVLLNLLARDESEDVRGMVASNPNTPRAALDLLLVDKESWISSAAAHHPLLKAEHPQAEPTPSDKQRLVAISLFADGVEGFYDPKTDTTVFLVDQIQSVERADELFWHENTHRNLTQFARTPAGKAELGVILKSAEPQLMTELPSLLKATGHRSLAHLKQDYGFGDTEAGQTAVLGELMARHAEKMVNVEPPTWWETLVNKVEVWMAKHAGIELTEGAITTWLARLPERLPEPEVESYDTGYTPWQPQVASREAQASYYQQGQSFGHDVN